MNFGNSTKLLGIIGYPLEHSLSPFMYNKALAHLGIDAVYLAFPVEPGRLKEAVEGAKALGIRGFNVTIPHKEKILEYLDELDEEAAAVEAVNLVVIEQGKTKGFNTDGAGFMMSLKENGVEIPGRALVFGAGGAAKSIGYRLAQEGWEVVFVNRRPDRACFLARRVHELTGAKAEGLELGSSELPRLLRQTDLVINTTPVGMYPRVAASLAVPWAEAKKDAVAVDIVYNPLHTSFLRGAAEAGIRTISGMGMLLYQGVISFKILTGHDAPVDVMQDALCQKLLENDPH